MLEVYAPTGVGEKWLILHFFIQLALLSLSKKTLILSLLAAMSVSVESIEWQSVV